MEQIDVYERMLGEFQKIKNGDTYSDISDNFFAVSGYPHYEKGPE